MTGQTALYFTARVPSSSPPSSPTHTLPQCLCSAAGKSRTPLLYSKKDKSSITKLSCNRNLALKRRSLHLQSGLKFAECVAPYNNEDVHYTNKEEQSRVQSVTSPIALQQLVLTPAHSALPPKLAKSALQPGLCQPYSTVAFARCASSDTRENCGVACAESATLVLRFVSTIQLPSCSRCWIY